MPFYLVLFYIPLCVCVKVVYTINDKDWDSIA